MPIGRRPGGSSGGSSKEKGRKFLAWVSFGFAVIAGAAVVATFVGSAITGLVGFFPAWVSVVAVFAATVGIGIDLFNDGEPNQLALYCAMLLPSLARATPGQLSDEITRASNNALNQVNDVLGVWLGTSSAFGIAAACAVVAFLMGRRVLAKGGS